jgi:F-type H+-transporting ATPase subunit b
MELIKEILKDTEFWEGLGLLIVLGGFWYLGVPKMLTASLDARARSIVAELEQAVNLRKEAETILVDYRQRATQAKKEAESIMVDAQAEAERMAVEARANLKIQIERQTKQAQDRIAQAERQALLEIRALAADAAAAAAEKIISARLDEKRAGALIEASLKDLPSKLN